MEKYLLFIITMTCSIGCSSFCNEPTVKILHSMEKDTLLKSFGISYVDLKGYKIIHINKRTSCVLQPLVTSDKGETNYFRLKLNKDKNTVYLIDGILSVGDILYNSRTTGIIFPIIKYQNEDDFSTTGEIRYFNTDKLLSYCIENNLENSEAVLTIVDCFVCTWVQTLCSHTIFPQKKRSRFSLLIIQWCIL